MRATKPLMSALKQARQYVTGALALAALSVSLITSTALALPNDHQQAISIESDRVLRNDKTGLTVYEGAVHMIQGSINIKADKVTLHTTKNKVSKIICLGAPALYQQQPEIDGGLVIAKASTIEYHLDRDLINLIKDASLKQEGSTLTGDIINYDLKAELIQARSDNTSNRRIQMVIPPSQQQEEQDSSTLPQVPTPTLPQAPTPTPTPTQETN